MLEKNAAVTLEAKVTIGGEAERMSRSRRVGPGPGSGQGLGPGPGTGPAPARASAPVPAPAPQSLHFYTAHLPLDNKTIQYDVVIAISY